MMRRGRCSRIARNNPGFTTGAGDEDFTPISQDSLYSCPFAVVECSTTEVIYAPCDCLSHTDGENHTNEKRRTLI